MGRLEVVGLALLAALCAAVGIGARERATAAVRCSTGSSGTLVATVMRDPWWWAWNSRGRCGLCVPSTRLSRGSLLLVQPPPRPHCCRAPDRRPIVHRRLTGSGMVLGRRADRSVWSLRRGRLSSRRSRPPAGIGVGVVVSIFVPLVAIRLVIVGRSGGRRRAVAPAVAVAGLLRLGGGADRSSTHRLAVRVGLHARSLVPAPVSMVVLAVEQPCCSSRAFTPADGNVGTNHVGWPVLTGRVNFRGHRRRPSTSPSRNASGSLLSLAVVAMVGGTVALARDTGVL